MLTHIRVDDFTFIENQQMFGRLDPEEIDELLHQQIVGRIGCHSDGVTYIVPISYAYDGKYIYAHTLEGMKIGFATDLGYMPVSVRNHLRGCHVLVMESNHDVEMLRLGPYPWSVKQRVMSRVGHLSNDSLAEFFANDYDGIAEYVVLAHLSEQNNHPEVARASAEQALRDRQGLWSNRVLLATQTEAMAPIRL